MGNNNTEGMIPIITNKGENYFKEAAIQKETQGKYKHSGPLLQLCHYFPLSSLLIDKGFHFKYLIHHKWVHHISLS